MTKEPLMTTRGYVYGIALVTGLCLIVGLSAGALSAWLIAASLQPKASAELHGKPLAEWNTKDVQAYAAGAAGSATMAVSTGAIDESVEGLYTLDFPSGNLMCFVMYARGPLAGKLGGIFQGNVLQALGLNKNKAPEYLMVTGGANFIQGTSQNRPAGCVCYVVDANTGAWGGYSLQFNPTLAGMGKPQQGALTLIARGVARPVAGGVGAGVP